MAVYKIHDTEREKTKQQKNTFHYGCTNNIQLEASSTMSMLQSIYLLFSLWHSIPHGYICQSIHSIAQAALHKKRTLILPHTYIIRGATVNIHSTNFCFWLLLRVLFFFFPQPSGVNEDENTKTVLLRQPNVIFIVIIVTIALTLWFLVVYFLVVFHERKK